MRKVSKTTYKAAIFQKGIYNLGANAASRTQHKNSLSASHLCSQEILSFTQRRQKRSLIYNHGLDFLVRMRSDEVPGTLRIRPTSGPFPVLQLLFAPLRFAENPPSVS